MLGASMLGSDASGADVQVSHTGKFVLLGVNINRSFGSRSFRVAGSRRGQIIGLSVVLTTNVGYREIERPRQFPADPIQGIEPRAAAVVLALHLPDHYFGIRKHVKRISVKAQGTLQCLKQSNVLGDIIVVGSALFADSDSTVGVAVDDPSNTRRAGIPERAAIDEGHEI